MAQFQTHLQRQHSSTKDLRFFPLPLGLLSKLIFKRINITYYSLGHMLILIFKWFWYTPRQQWDVQGLWPIPLCYCLDLLKISFAGSSMTHFGLYLTFQKVVTSLQLDERQILLSQNESMLPKKKQRVHIWIINSFSLILGSDLIVCYFLRH